MMTRNVYRALAALAIAFTVAGCQSNQAVPTTTFDDAQGDAIVVTGSDAPTVGDFTAGRWKVKTSGAVNMLSTDAAGAELMTQSPTSTLVSSQSTITTPGSITIARASVRRFVLDEDGRPMLDADGVPYTEGAELEGVGLTLDPAVEYARVQGETVRAIVPVLSAMVQTTELQRILSNEKTASDLFSFLDTVASIALGPGGFVPALIDQGAANGVSEALDGIPAEIPAPDAAGPSEAPPGGAVGTDAPES